jgi:hypothetical protein
MQFLLLIYGVQGDYTKLNPAELGALHQEYGAFTKGIMDSGKYVGGNQLKPIETARTVRVRNGKQVVTDGPFAETKEQLGGYYLVNAKDHDEAVAIAARIPAAKTGSVEVRPIVVMEQARPA